MKLSLGSEANSESCQTSKMALFAKIDKSEKPFTICKNLHLGCLKGSEYASELASKVSDVLYLNQFWVLKVINITEIFQNLFHVDLHFT